MCRLDLRLFNCLFFLLFYQIRKGCMLQVYFEFYFPRIEQGIQGNKLHVILEVKKPMVLYANLSVLTE